MTTSEKKLILLTDAAGDVLDLDRLKDESLLETAIYRCLELYFEAKGEIGLEKVLLMWDDISRRSRREPDEK